MKSIIEDQSPYFIKFFIKDYESKISQFNSILPEYLFSDEITNNENYIIYDLNNNEREIFFKLFSCENIIKWNDMIRIVSVKKGFTGPLHKDGTYNTPISNLNIGLSIKDKFCKTYWFNDTNILSRRRKLMLDNKQITARISNANWKILEPDATTVLHQNELIVFNADIFHTWDNSSSEHARVTLKLRPHGAVDFYSLKSHVIKFFNI